MNQIKRSKFSLRMFLILVCAEGVLSLISLLMIPGDPKNAWILGLSKSRLLMLIMMFLCVGFVSFLVCKM